MKLKYNFSEIAQVAYNCAISYEEIIHRTSLPKYDDLDNKSPVIESVKMVMRNPDIECEDLYVPFGNYYEDIDVIWRTRDRIFLQAIKSLLD